MKLKFNIDPLTASIYSNEIIYAVLELGNAQLLVELMKNTRKESQDFVQKEIFKNASQDLKLKMHELAGSNSSINFEKFNLASQPEHTFGFNKRAFEVTATKEIELSGNCFYSLQKAILENFNAVELLNFANIYNVNDKLFLKKLNTFGSVFALAYEKNILNDSKYYKDEMQLF